LPSERRRKSAVLVSVPEPTKKEREKSALDAERRVHRQKYPTLYSQEDASLVSPFPSLPVFSVKKTHHPYATQGGVGVGSKARLAAAGSVVDDIVEQIRIDTCTSDEPHARDYRRMQVESVLEDVLSEVIVRHQQQVAEDLLEVESVLDDCLALVETGEAPYIRSQKVHLWLNGQLFTPDILYAQVMNRPLNSKMAKQFCDRLDGTSQWTNQRKFKTLKKPRNAYSLYRTHRYEERKKQLKKQKLAHGGRYWMSGHRGKNTPGVGPDEDEATFAQDVKRDWKEMSPEDTVVWTNLELIKRYDSCRTLYGPEKVYGHHDPHQEAVAAVKTFPKTRYTLACAAGGFGTVRLTPHLFVFFPGQKPIFNCFAF
jgi:hypothetical protein